MPSSLFERSNVYGSFELDLTRALREFVGGYGIIGFYVCWLPAPVAGRLLRSGKQVDPEVFGCLTTSTSPCVRTSCFLALESVKNLLPRECFSCFVTASANPDSGLRRLESPYADPIGAAASLSASFLSSNDDVDDSAVLQEEHSVSASQAPTQPLDDPFVPVFDEDMTDEF